MKVPYVRAALPLLLGYLTRTNGCNINTPITKLTKAELLSVGVLVAIGVAWELSRSSKQPIDLGFAVLLFAIFWRMWLACHGEPTKAKLVVVMIAAIAAVLIWITAQHDPRVSLLLIPLMWWILFVEKLPPFPRHFELPFVTVDLPRVVDGRVTFHGLSKRT